MFKIGDLVEGMSNIGIYVRGRVIQVDNDRTSVIPSLLVSCEDVKCGVWCYLCEGVHLVDEDKEFKYPEFFGGTCTHCNKKATLKRFGFEGAYMCKACALKRNYEEFKEPV